MEKKVQPTRYLRAREVAKVLGFTVGHVDNLRHQGRGPSYRKFGGAVRYDWKDVIAWAEAQTKIEPGQNLTPQPQEVK
jgi:predicted DNA-binding transcriptional regulator AlpA